MSDVIRILKNFSISKKENEICIIDYGKQIHILTSRWGEVTSVQLNKTETKRLINWLNKWVSNNEM